ncbi:hypothetical protein TNIN_125021 [Trichonephila inaurata madagascariensis]|uniref:Uncharacterized protein n=1 Tax=Trichonephila inaurata madagascariensis TaxID=2747483 RepID=A0A8X6XSU1_9ARAC|nr:hypothetical protein TNIN_125021 [Trichonephila inaurata madagascariensis]
MCIVFFLSQTPPNLFVIRETCHLVPSLAELYATIHQRCFRQRSHKRQLLISKQWATLLSCQSLVGGKIANDLELHKARYTTSFRHPHIRSIGANLSVPGIIKNGSLTSQRVGIETQHSHSFTLWVRGNCSQVSFVAVK